MSLPRLQTQKTTKLFKNVVKPTENSTEDDKVQDKHWAHQCYCPCKTCTLQTQKLSTHSLEFEKFNSQRTDDSRFKDIMVKYQQK